MRTLNLILGGVQMPPRPGSGAAIEPGPGRARLHSKRLWPCSNGHESSVSLFPSSFQYVLSFRVSCRRCPGLCRNRITSLSLPDLCSRASIHQHCLPLSSDLNSYCPHHNARRISIASQCVVVSHNAARPPFSFLVPRVLVTPSQ